MNYPISWENSLLKRAIFGPTSRSSFTGCALFLNSPAGAAYSCCDVIEALSG